MNVVVYINGGPDEGRILLSRELQEEELLTERIYAAQVAAELDRELAESYGVVPNCSGDIRVEFMDNKPKTEKRADGERYYLGQVCVWSGESFYFRE